MMPNWDEWGRHVLQQLEQQRQDHLQVRGDLNDIKVQLATLKVRAGLWGMLAGVVPVIAALLWKLL
jgi:hypothetical protein